MESDILKYIMDYGLAFLVMAGVIWWLSKVVSKKVDDNSEDIRKNTEAVQQNSQTIDKLAQAITALTENTSRMYEVCERAFEDNRHTLEVLIKHIEKEEK